MADEANAPLILIADDEPAAGYSLSRTLQRAGYRTEEAADGERALEAIQRQPPNLIILDIYMPGLNGFEVLRRVRENPMTAN